MTHRPILRRVAAVWIARIRTACRALSDALAGQSVTCPATQAVHRERDALYRAKHTALAAYTGKPLPARLCVEDAARRVGA